MGKHDRRKTLRDFFNRWLSRTAPAFLATATAKSYSFFHRSSAILSVKRGLRRRAWNTRKSLWKCNNDSIKNRTLQKLVACVYSLSPRPAEQCVSTCLLGTLPVQQTELRNISAAACPSCVSVNQHHRPQVLDVIIEIRNNRRQGRGFDLRSGR